ncbi:MAG TPA: heme NO-binding domain-containing protein [Chitinispirillaceae bacterium]|nr:heme NO-binding domain-containing protein [Chitinispirillaceae bacterium]
MKGVIAMCLAELVESKFGKAQLETVLEKSGIDKFTRFLPSQDIPDDKIMNVVKNAGEILKMSMPQLADAFGDYWVNTFAPKIYKTYYNQATSAKEFITKMDSVHISVTQNIANSHPPRFEYCWKNEKTVEIMYKSQRKMIVFLIGLIKGVGKRFNERLSVVQLSDDKLQVTFP